MDYKIKNETPVAKEPLLDNSNVNVSDILNSIETPKELSITKEDEDRFFECVVSSTMYSESIKIMNGRMEITFRDRSSAELTDIISRVGKDNVKTEADFEFRLRMYHLVYAIDKIKYYNEDGRVKSEEKISNLDFDDKLAHIHKYSSQKYIIVIKTMDRFNLKLDKLTEMSSKKNL